MPERNDFYRKVIVTNRSLEEYECSLGIYIEGFRGQTVLDIGAGKHLTFARQAMENGVNVISLNPKLQFPRQRRRITPLRRRILGLPDEDRPPAIAAIAQKLPLADASVDAVFSLWAAPYWLPEEPAQIEAFFEESMRVLKPGGDAYFFPIGGNYEYDKKRERVMRRLVAGYRYRISSANKMGWYNLSIIKNK